MSATINIPLSSIIIDDKTQHRKATNYGHIENIRDSILDGDTINPIKVIKAIDQRSSNYYLVDGFHRVEAFYSANKKNIDAIILSEGSINDAIYASLPANADHGNTLIRLNGDIEKACHVAVQYVFDDKRRKRQIESGTNESYPEVSTNEIADIVKCSSRQAKKAVSKFNTHNREIRNRRIYEDLEKGESITTIAHRYDIPELEVYKAKEGIDNRIRYENNRGSGWSRQRELGYDLTESDYRGEARCNHRTTEPDFKVEADLTEYLLINHFFGANENITELNCATGRVDILTDNELIEVKRELSRKNIHSAIGQLMLYKNFFKGRKLTIAGYFHSELSRLSAYIADIGIDVVVVQPGGNIERIVKGIANGV